MFYGHNFLTLFLCQWIYASSVLQPFCASKVIFILFVFVFTVSKYSLCLRSFRSSFIWCKAGNRLLTVSDDNHSNNLHLFYIFCSPQKSTCMLKLHLIEWTRVVTQVRDLSLGLGFPWPFHSGHLCGQIAGLFTWGGASSVLWKNHTLLCSEASFPLTMAGIIQINTPLCTLSREELMPVEVSDFIWKFKGQDLAHFKKSVAGIIRTCFPINVQI